MSQGDKTKNRGPKTTEGRLRSLANLTNVGKKLKSNKYYLNHVKRSGMKYVSKKDLRWLAPVKRKELYVYLAEENRSDVVTPYYKIGCTVNPERRKHGNGSDSPFPLFYSVVFWYETNTYNLEKFLPRRLHNFRTFHTLKGGMEGFDFGHDRESVRKNFIKCCMQFCKERNLKWKIIK